MWTPTVCSALIASAPAAATATWQWFSNPLNKGVSAAKARNHMFYSQQLRCLLNRFCCFTRHSYTTSVPNKILLLIRLHFATFSDFKNVCIHVQNKKRIVTKSHKIIYRITKKRRTLVCQKTNLFTFLIFAFSPPLVCSNVRIWISIMQLVKRGCK